VIRIHSTGLLFHLFSRVGQTDLKTFFSRPEYLSYPGCITSRASILSLFFFFFFFCIFHIPTALLAGPRYFFCIFHIPTALLAGPRYNFNGRCTRHKRTKAAHKSHNPPGHTNTHTALRTTHTLDSTAQRSPVRCARARVHRLEEKHNTNRDQKVRKIEPSSLNLSLSLSLSASSSEAQARKRKRARASLRRSGGRRKRIISRRGMHVTIHNMRMCGEMTEILVEAGSRAHD